eukprot:3270560-Amphidinium_carterae.1
MHKSGRSPTDIQVSLILPSAWSKTHTEVSSRLGVMKSRACTKSPQEAQQHCCSKAQNAHNTIAA